MGSPLRSQNLLNLCLYSPGQMRNDLFRHTACITPHPRGIKQNRAIKTLRTNCMPLWWWCLSSNLLLLAVFNSHGCWATSSLTNNPGAFPSGNSTICPSLVFDEGMHRYHSVIHVAYMRAMQDPEKDEYVHE